EEAMMLADRIAILKDGQLQQIGSPTEVYNHPQSAFVARFMGAANIFDVDAIEDDSETLRLTTRGGLVMSTAWPAAADVAAGAIRSAILRPEAIRIVREGAGATANRYAATLASVAHVGPVCRLKVVLD